MKTRRTPACLLPLILASLLLNACSDGGAIVAPGPGGCGFPLTSSEGVWIGSATFTGGGSLIGMIAGGDLMIIQLDDLNDPLPTRMYAGRYDPQTGIGTADRYSGGGRLVEAQLPLNIAVGRTLNVTIGAAQNLMALCPMLDNTRLLIYNRDSVTEGGINLIDAQWRYALEPTPNFAGYTFDLAADAIGTMTGQDSPNGCNYSGFWQDPRPDRNLYRIEDMTLAGQAGACDGEDQSGVVVFDNPGTGYQGFALFLDATPFTANNLWMTVANGSAAFFTPFVRQGPSPLPPPPTGGGDEDDF